MGEKQLTNISHDIEPGDMDTEQGDFRRKTKHFNSINDDENRLSESKNNFAKNLFHYLSVCSISFTMGWVNGVRGPAFHYFLTLTNTNTAQGSMFVTSFQTGTMIGSLSGGFIIDKWNTHIIPISGCLVVGITVIAMPWCNIFWVMLILMYLQGHALNTALLYCFIECTRIWRGEKSAQTHMQMFFFLIPLGALLSPLVVAEFLKDGRNVNTTSDITLNKTKLRLISNDTSVKITDELHIPFIITGILCFLVAIPAVCLLCYRSPHVKRRPVQTTEGPGSVKNICAYKKSRLIIAMSLICTMMFVENGTDNLITQFLPYFLLTEMKWKTYLSSDIMSLFWGMFVVGRLIGTASSRILKPFTQLMLSAIFMLASLSLFVLAFNLRNDVLIWVATAAQSLASSNVQACILVWALSEVVPATGKTTSIVEVFGSVGGMALPPILGNLMQYHNPMYIVYMPLMNVALLILTQVCLFYFVRHQSNSDSKTNEDGQAPVLQ